MAPAIVLAYSSCRNWQHALQVASLLSGHPILIEGFTAFLPDKTAFFHLDGQSGGPAHPSKGPSRSVLSDSSGTPCHHQGQQSSTVHSTCFGTTHLLQPGQHIETVYPACLAFTLMLTRE